MQTQGQGYKGHGIEPWFSCPLHIIFSLWRVFIGLTQSLLMAMLHSLIARRRFGPQTQWRPLRKTLTSGLGLDDMSLVWPPWFNYWFSFTLVYSRISHEYSSLFIIVINLIFLFSLWCIDWVGSLYANRNFMYFCIKSSMGPKVKLASCKSALNPTVVCYANRSKAVVPVLVLLFVVLWLILRGDFLYVFPCVILFLCFSVLLVLRLPRLGKRELILVLFVRLFGLCLFRFVGFLFLLGSGKGCGLWLWHSLESLTFFDWIFASVRWCAEPLTQPSQLKVKVAIESHEPWISCPLHISFTNGIIFMKLWSNVCLREIMCRTHNTAMPTQGQNHN